MIQLYIYSSSIIFKKEKCKRKKSCPIRPRNKKLQDNQARVFWRKKEGTGAFGRKCSEKISDGSGAEIIRSKNGSVAVTLISPQTSISSKLFRLQNNQKIVRHSSYRDNS